MHVGRRQREVQDGVCLDVPLALDLQRVAEDGLRMLRLAECHKARALVVGDVQVVAVEVHAVAPLLRVRAVDAIVRLVLSVAEGARIPETGMRSGLQRPEPCLSSHVQAAPCMVLAATDQGEGFSRLAVVGGNKAPSSKYPASQRIILGFACGL